MQDTHPATPVPPGPALVVLDTNVALALCLWRDPRLGPLAEALNTGRLQWRTDEPTWLELLHELRPARCLAAGTSVQAATERLLAVPRQHGPAPPRTRPLPPRLRCRDADDQKFVELAWDASIPLLLSRDRAVLALRRPAAAAGLRIQRPEDWVGSRAGRDGRAA